MPRVEQGSEADGADRPPAVTHADPRVLQANERTLLAWLRTGIALTGFGFLIARLGAWIAMMGDRDRAIPGAGWIGAVFVLLGAAGNVIAIYRYLAFRKAALSQSAPPTAHLTIVVFAVAVTAMGALLGAFVVARFF